MYIYIYIYIYVYLYVRIDICYVTSVPLTHKHIHTRIYINKHMYTDLHTHIQQLLQCASPRECLYVKYVCIYIYIYIYTHTYTHTPGGGGWRAATSSISVIKRALTCCKTCTKRRL